MKISLKNKNNFGRKATRDNEEENDDLLSEEDSGTIKKSIFKVR